MKTALISRVCAHPSVQASQLEGWQDLGKAHRDEETGTLRGWSPDKYYMTSDAFENFAMAARTKVGNTVRAFFGAIRDPYVDLTRNPPSAFNREEALLMAFHRKNVLYIGEIQGNGERTQRICKVGHNADIAKRCETHKEYLRSSLYFQLMQVGG
ncbi:hypothetical protein KFL_006280070 [Klebsormidium nitens]|uniref:Uncharacterized protein n=1 Tax=Klebsormidium nitens TaxID=105231 RepID=A0A1Y1IJN1_KLENI|nr:hypothetical protein KFL_006280070 [Klebsormidium nitens]|eukprot:GAQ90332.1 hypothetical protein KFL_006280070 [Klebsormidium nitens]